MQAFIRHAPIAMAMFDRRMNYLVASGRWVVEYGRGHADLVGLNHHDVHPDLPEWWRDVHRQALAGATLKNEEELWTQADGSQHWLRWAVLPWFDDSAAIGGIIISVEDITERKRAEETARLYEKAKELDRVKTGFFAAVSHELRTPLALILGPTERLLYSGTLAPAEREDLVTVGRNARALLKHVNDLLSVAKLEAGRMELDYAELDLAVLLSRVASFFDALARERRIDWRIEIDSPVRVEADPDKVERVVLNLLSNAFKFAPEGGRVRLSLRREDGGDCAVLEVADSGPGVPAEHRELVFERFRQLDPGSSGRFGGTGLGLTIVSEFVRLHRGTVHVDSAPDGGALFTVTLPAHAPGGARIRTDAGRPPASELPRPLVEELPPPSATVRGPAAAPRILVIEDNREMNRFLCDALCESYRAAAAFDGKEGLQRAASFKPDLVLCDVMMPELSGCEFVRALRKDPDFSTTPIVVLTASGDDELRVRLLREGAQDYLTKPFSVEELRARISNLIARKLAEDAVREAEARFRGILALAADAIISVDEDQRIVLYNEGARAIFGWSEEEVLGRPLDLLLPERLRASHQRSLSDFAAGDMTGENRPVFVGLRKNGEEFPAQAAVSKVEVGGRTLFTTLLQDIGDRQREDAAGRFLSEVGAIFAETLDYRETLRSIAQQVVRFMADWCLIDVLEKDGAVRRLEVVSADPASSDVAESLKQKPFDPKRPFLTRSVFDDQAPRIMTTVPPDFFGSFALTDEQRQMLEVVSAKSLMTVPLLSHGRFIGALVFISSRESRRYTERDLPLATELAHRAALAIENARLYETTSRAVEARDEVLGIVAHDLRNPLGAILMASDRLRRRGREQDRASQESGETIQRAALRMNRLIQDLLDVTCIEAGHFSVDVRRVSARQMLQDCAEGQRELASSRRVELSVELPDDRLAIAADPDRLLQVLENLVGNSMKFTPSGGRITIGGTAQDGEVLFWVRDTGQGIPAENLPHVFDRFWQATRGAHRGAGLGLVIVKGIIEAHHGRTWVESAVGQGTSFCFTMPIAPRAEDTSSVPSARAARAPARSRGSRRRSTVKPSRR